MHVRLFLIFVLIFLIPLAVLTTVFLKFYYNIYTEESRQATCREMDSVASSINSQFKSAASYLGLISLDSDIRLHLSGGADMEIGSYDSVEDLKSIVRRYSMARPEFFNMQIILLSSENEVLLGREYLDSTHDSSSFIRIIDSSLPSSLKSTIWFTDEQVRESAHNGAYVYIARVIKDTSTWDTLGYAILRFRISDLTGMYLGYTNKYRSICVTDGRGHIVSFVDGLLVKDTIIEENKAKLLVSSEPITINSLTAYSNLLINQWYLLSVTETGISSQPALKATLVMYMMAQLICVTLMLSIAYYTFKKFTEPMNLLTSSMKKVEQGDLYSRVSINTKDEFEDLANNYNKMIAQIEDLMDRVIFEQEQKRLSDIRMLQAQINPHFLYNTLGSIRYMIYANPPQDVDNVILSLSKFLNYVLSGTEIYVSIDRAMEQMNNYIAIQSYGFDVPMRYEMDIDERIHNCKILKMLLQPLIENALLHGLKLNTVNPTLKIKAFPLDDKTMQIEIIDNGPGFNVALTDSSSESTSVYGHHMGLANVRNRLQLYYGNSYQLDIKSEMGVGTTVTVCIPRVTEERNKDENFDS